MYAFIFVTVVDSVSFSDSLMRERCSEISPNNQMTFKLPYTGRSIKYYTVPVVSCVVLGRFEGFGSAVDGLTIKK